MTNPTPPADKPVEPEGYYTTRTKGADGKPIPSYWMPKLPPRQRAWHKRDGSTALDRAEAKKQAQEEADKRYKTAREMAADLDAQDKGDERSDDNTD